jgi:hypothetical protein
VVAADAGDAALAQERDGFLWERAAVHEVARADDALASELGDAVERIAHRVHVGVDVGDDRELGHDGLVALSAGGATR